MGVSVRVRYAPSPTGHLHIGGARTALFNWLFARHHGGAFILRFEDTDRARQVPQAEEKMIRALRWLGLDWDEGPDVGGPYGPYRSMERLDIYRRHVEQLLDRGLAYRCYCSPEELEAERETMRRRGEMPRYSGKCRSLTEKDWARFDAEGRPFTIRFRVPAGQVVRFVDLVRGEVRFESDGIGDFVILKSDGVPTYNFAVTVDDYLMRITHVIRGEEHLSNTPNQLLLYQALGFEPPAFAHVSLILNESGKKLSKRDESIVQFVEQYEALGYVPEAMINYLALLGWSPGGEREIFSLQELIRVFSLERVGKSGAVFDPQKLRWMNGHYLRERSDEELLSLCWPHMVAAGFVPPDASPERRAWCLRVVRLYRDQLEYAAQLPELAGWLKDPEAPGPGEEEVLDDPSAGAAVAAFYSEAVALVDWTPEQIQAAFKRVQKTTGLRGRGLYMPVRVAATGRAHGPELPEVLALLGRETVLNRLRSLLMDRWKEQLDLVEKSETR
ncbi:MAG: glutamate--tRNA ligase [Alicyclobacillaceae bacterium]|nr:glutamate--tRNA ligase [Alicyclobacillaceae bacterium]